MIRDIFAYLFLIAWASWVGYHLILIITNGGTTLVASEPNQFISIPEVIMVSGTIILGIERIGALIRNA